MIPVLRYRANAADVKNCPTASAEVYMSIGQVGPRTLPKCRISGTKLVRNLVSMMTAALFVTEPLQKFPTPGDSVGFASWLFCVEPGCASDVSDDIAAGSDIVDPGLWFW